MFLHVLFTVIFAVFVVIVQVHIEDFRLKSSIPEEVSNKMVSYKAVVIGATGAVGSEVVKELLNSPRCSGITTLVRKVNNMWDSIPEAKDKLIQREVNFDKLEESADLVQNHQIAFCTLGVGQPSKVSRDEFWKVDVEYVSKFSKICKSAGVKHISLLGGVGANPNSSTFAFKVKGEAENVCKGFPRSSFFRPSLLVTPTIRYGMQDKITQFFFPILSVVLPSYLHEIKVSDLARAMRINAEIDGKEGEEVLYWKDFEALLKLE